MSVFCFISLFSLLLFYNIAIASEPVAATAEIYFSKGSPIVNLFNSNSNENAGISGSVKFSRNGRPYLSFMGIPFATVKERFAPSILLKKPNWTGIKNGTDAGPFCPQKKPFAEGYIDGDEHECLNLNVYVPMNAKPDSNGLPVMVWVHGGGFQFGSGSTYGAKFFMDEDVILVTINYRLGVFGFLSTGDEVVPGNNGMKDQVRALEWVQENIGWFGGDNGRVTVFGESAGGSATSFLLLSPTTKGFVHRVISQSASAINPWPYMPDPKQHAIKLAKFLECPSTDSSEEILDCLKSKTVEELNKAQIEFTTNWPPQLESMIFVPVTEPVPSMNSNNVPFITVSPFERLSDTSKFVQNIPWIVGITSDEGFLMAPTLAEQMGELNQKWEDLAPSSLNFDRYFPKSKKDQQDIVSKKARKFYFGDDETVSVEKRKSAVDLYGDLLFTFGIRKAAIQTALKGNKVFLYEFEQYAFGAEVANPEFKGIMDVMNPYDEQMTGHGQDCYSQFDDVGWFPNEVETQFIQPGSSMEKFSRHFVKLWVSFATNGEPTHTWGESPDKWTPISIDEITENNSILEYYKIDKSGTKFIKERFTERMDFWEDIWKQHFEPVLKSDNKNNQRSEL